MGKQFGGRGARGTGSGRKGGAPPGAAKDPLQHVPKFKYFAKNVFAPYPSEDGCPFYLGDADDEKSFFKKGFIAENVATADSCEALWRLGMAVALYSSSFQVGGGALVDHVDECGRVGDKTGFPQLGDLLRSPEGQAFMKAAKTLNVGIGGRVSRAEAKAAVKTYVSFLTKKEPQLRKAASRAASFSAKVYQATMCMLEHMDLLACPKTWASAMQGGKNQPALTQKWIRDPKDQGKLVEALTESFLQKMDKSKKPKGAKKAAADSTDDEDDKGASSAAAGSEDASDNSGAEDEGDESNSDKSEEATGGESSDGEPKRKRGRAAGAGDRVAKGKVRRTSAKKIEEHSDGEIAASPKASRQSTTGSKRKRRENDGKSTKTSDRRSKAKPSKHRADDLPADSDTGEKSEPGKQVDQLDAAARHTVDDMPETKPRMKLNIGKLQLALTEWEESDMKEVSSAVDAAKGTAVAIADASRQAAIVASIAWLDFPTWEIANHVTRRSMVWADLHSPHYVSGLIADPGTVAEGLVSSGNCFLSSWAFSHFWFLWSVLHRSTVECSLGRA